MTDARLNDAVAGKQKKNELTKFDTPSAKNSYTKFSKKVNHLSTCKLIDPNQSKNNHVFKLTWLARTV